MKTIYISKLDRRTTLKWLASSLALSAAPGYAVALGASPKQTTGSQHTNGLPVTWQRLFSQDQLQLAATLADLILPETDDAPAPSQLGIPEFIDEWVSAPHPDQLKDRKLILEGFSWLDKASRKQFGTQFDRLVEHQQLQILDSIAQPDENGEPNLEQSFFIRLRYLVVGAYYTTEEGFKDIGYIGNVPLAEYPSVSAKEKEILDKELENLGVLIKKHIRR